jgi:NitT/TauT family transport system ATP-binding protein
MSEAVIELSKVTKRFAAPRGTYTALQDVSFRVGRRRFVALVGPSGCGKTTLLNLVAGLTTPTAGRVTVFGNDLRGLNRSASYLFQQDALLPWKTVRQNVHLGLQLRGIGDGALVPDWLRRVGLEGFADFYPSQLSGGMRKRAALAQCLIVEPNIVLMDEPFAALDVHTRLRMESELLELWAASQATVVFVTHDLEEAIALADEVMVLSAGPGSRVVGSYPIPLDRPRDLMELKTDTRFLDLYKEIWATLRREVAGR